MVYRDPGKGEIRCWPRSVYSRLRSEEMDMLKGRECATCTILTLNAEMHCHASTDSEGLHIHTP